MAKEKKKKKGKKKKSGIGLLGWLIVLSICIGLAFLLQQSSVILLVGILPSVVAYIVDDTMNRAWFKTVFSFNLAGLVPYLSEAFILYGNQMEAIQKKLYDFNMWGVIYLCAGMGWLTLWVCPKIMQVALRLYYQSRIDMNKNKLQQIESEYSLD